MEISSPKKTIWAVTDGRAGNVAMASGLAEAVAARVGAAVEQRDTAVRSPWHLLPARVFAAMPRATVLAAATPLLPMPRPDLVIGAGRRVAPFLAALRRETKVVQILDSGIAPGRFDLVITPEHDGLAGANVVRTLGSVHGITPDNVAAEAGPWAQRFAALPVPRIAVLIGGSTKRAKLSDGAVQRFADDLRHLANGGAGLMLTASRRTGEAHQRLLRTALPGAYFWDGTGENPYRAMLGTAEAIIVTDDSVNMASEAAATGKPLAIYPLLRDSAKLERFHEALFHRGHAEPFLGKIPLTCADPLTETARAADRVAALLR